MIKFSRLAVFIAILCASMPQVFAQQTTIYTEANANYKQGRDLYQQGVYGIAQQEFKKTIDLLRPVNEPQWLQLKTDAELQYAKCAVRLGQPEAEKLVLDFLRENTPSPLATQAALEIGDYYFNDKKYDEAITYYNMAPSGVSSGKRAELQFKKGYSYFVSKKFPQAKSEFGKLTRTSTTNEYYYPANYYYGCCLFFEGKYDEAAKSFKVCEGSSTYQKFIPYYTSQILFAQKKYQEVVNYAGPKAKDSSLRNIAEINQLVGKAYYELGDYKNALPYLEYGSNQGARLTASDFYQIGFTQYQAGFYKEAIQNFEQLSKSDSLMGQNGLYHLGDCYVRTGNKVAARNAFGQASSMDYNLKVREEALFNFAKLSYELKYDQDAITALQKIKSGSPMYNDAQALMGDIFVNTRDYARAINVLEALPNRSSEMNETYQKVTFLRGIQLYQNNDLEAANTHFQKSLSQPKDRIMAAESAYWLGEIWHKKGDYDRSIDEVNAFLGVAKNKPTLPESSSIYTGNYLQGYNYLKSKDYAKALTYFKATVDGIKKDESRIESEKIKSEIIGDATLRAGDCHFKAKKYDAALQYYNEALSQKYNGYEYALYQKAIIQGLNKQPVEKIVSLEKLVKNHPNSQFIDEALFQLGITYQELGKLDQAIPPLRQLVEQFRGKSGLYNQALLRLGLISYNQGNNPAAINYYKQVFSNNPETNEANDALAALQEIYVKELGQPDEYFAFLETVPGYKVGAVEKDSVTFQAAETQFNQARYAQAIDAYTSYITKYPNGRNYITALYHRGDSYASDAVKKYREAVRDYAAVVNKGQNKHYAKSCEKAALIAYNIEQDFSNALSYAQKWEQSASTDISKTEAQVLALRCAYRLNNLTSLTEFANKINNNALATNQQRATANYYLGKSAYDKGDYAKAFPALQNTTKLIQSEEMAESYHLMAQILYKQKKYDEAEKLIDDSNQAMAGYDDWIARNIILASDILVVKGDEDTARAALEAVIENYKGKDQSILDLANQKYKALGGTPTNRIVKPSGAAGLLEMDDN
jgi:tetratricopeptide (TPR) repeat protein